MEIVFFIYGLSFFVLGLVVFLLTDVTSKYKLAPCFWLLATFGLLHGINEWLEMFLFHGQNNFTTTTIMWLMHVNFFLLISSFLFLLTFGIQALIVIKRDIISWLNSLTLFLCFFIFLGLMTHAVLFTYHYIGHKSLTVFVILTRYSFGFSGAFLTGLAFLIWKNQAEIKNLGSKVISISFVGIGITFISYAIFTGLIVPKAAFFPASILNYPSFIKAFGVPVQVVRTVYALMITVCIFGVLKIFYYREKSDLIGRAKHDALTKLYNRQAFDDIYMKECDRSKRYKKPLSILFVDIDEFKNYNDKYGHMAGDVVLKFLAKLMCDYTRSVDYVFRYGGEEFIILLPETDKQAALVTAERIRIAFSQMKLKPKKDDIEIHKTISIGVVTFVTSNKNPFRFIDLADKAMYKAKQAGKNKVCVNGDEC